jgi:monoterpene epsilon-lactone hydrolase
MTEIRHEISAADRAAMTTFRAELAAHPAPITRASFDALFERMPPPEGVDYTEASVRAVPGVWCVPRARRAAAALLYLHGGVFGYGSARAFRHVVGQMVVRTGVAAFIADYRLAPEHAFPAALDDARAAYGGLATQYGDEHVAVIGDSAGGGLALTILLERPRVSCAVLLSPWTDLALTGGTFETKAADDPVLKRVALAAAADAYLGGHDPRDPKASPLYGLAGVTSPVQVHVGTSEILLDDSLRLASEPQIEVHVWEEMPHVFPSSLGVFTAAQEAHGLVAAFLRSALAV